MAHDKKLTKEIVFNAIGKEKSSLEFLAILEILGEPKIKNDIDSDRVDYTWSNHGINIVLSHETELFYNIFFYPNGTKNDEEYIIDKKSCKTICQENDFDQNLTMEEVREKYGNPDIEKETYGGYVFRYSNIHGYKIFFTFIDETQLYSIMIGWKE